MTYTAALFDLDGTLLDTIPDLADATNAMLQALGLHTLPQDTIATFVGKGTGVLVERALNAQPHDTALPDHALALDTFHACYHECNGNRARLYPGVMQGLDTLRDAGLALGVVTNKPTAFSLPLLEQAGLASYFKHIVCGDTCARKKPHPMPFQHACTLLGVRPAHAVAVGDSVNDALSARAAGLTVLAVPYGYNEGNDVQSLDVDDIVSGIDEAAKWVLARNACALPR